MQITVPAMCGIAIWHYMSDILSKICLVEFLRENNSQIFLFAASGL
jgi:hypothetical protein